MIERLGILAGKYWRQQEKSTSTMYEMNQRVEQIQAKLDAKKKRLAYLPDGTDSNKNSVEPSDSIKGGKARRQNIRNE